MDLLEEFLGYLHVTEKKVQVFYFLLLLLLLEEEDFLEEDEVLDVLSLLTAEAWAATWASSLSLFNLASFSCLSLFSTLGS